MASSRHEKQYREGPGGSRAQGKYSADEDYSVLRWLFRTGCEEAPRSGGVHFPCLSLQLCSVGEGALQIGVLQELRSKEWQNKEACQPFTVTGVQFAQEGIVIPFGAGESPEQSRVDCRVTSALDHDSSGN